MVRDSIVASIPACHAGDRGSIPRLGALFFSSSTAALPFLSDCRKIYHSHLYGTALPSMWNYKMILHEVRLGALFLHSCVPMFVGLLSGTAFPSVWDYKMFTLGVSSAGIEPATFSV